MEMADQRAENNVVSDQPQNSIADFDPPKKPKTKKFVVACAVLASMTSILLGYGDCSLKLMDIVSGCDIGVMSGASLFIKENLNISDVQVEVLNGTLNIYSLIGSALADKTSDWIGRRYTIVLAGTIFFIGALLMGFAPNYAFLMFGRFIAGVGVGYALMIAPVYTAEISPASFRGFLTSFPKPR
ncbi:polyol transporter 5-like [Malus domestica]|uniref:polyol transporter 5-like n=1 Tax=Malus domestica TaxID=3750 RepID=UPI0039757838